MEVATKIEPFAAMLYHALRGTYLIQLCLFSFHIGTYLLLVEVPFAKGALATEPAMAVFDADSRSHSAPTMAAALPLWLPDGAAEDALQEGDSIDKRKLSHY